MLWITLILVSVVTLGVYDVCKKHAVHGNAAMPVLFRGTRAGTGAVVGALLAVGKLGRWGSPGAGWARTDFQWRWTIPMIGLVLVVSDYLCFSALAQPGAMISVLSPIRRSKGVIPFLVGGGDLQGPAAVGEGGALGAIVVGVRT